MSITTQIERIQQSRDKLRTKAVDLGIGTATDKLDVLATKFDGITNNGQVQAEVKEGETYTIPRGYHNGTGTVSGVAGGGNYALQEKTITPTKSQQSVVSDDGYYGLSGVTVGAIPDAYQDVTSVTAGKDDVLTGKVIVGADGTVITGTMTNNGAIDVTVDTETTLYTVPKGYHDGTGTVKVVLEEKAVTPTKTEQEIVPTTGKVLSSVTVAPIPEAYQDVTGVTAGAEDVLSGKKIVGADGTVITGSMANNGAIAETIDGLTVTSYTVPAGYTTGGTVSLTSDIEDLLSAI